MTKQERKIVLALESIGQTVFGRKLETKFDCEIVIHEMANALCIADEKIAKAGFEKTPNALLLAAKLLQRAIPGSERYARNLATAALATEDDEAA